MEVSVKLFVAYDDHGEPQYYILANSIQEARKRIEQEGKSCFICPITEEKVFYVQS